MALTHLPAFAISSGHVHGGAFWPDDDGGVALAALPDGTRVYVVVPESSLPVHNPGQLAIASAGDELAIKIIVPHDAALPPPGSLYVSREEVDPSYRKRAAYVVAYLEKDLLVDFDPKLRRNGLLETVVFVPFLEAHATNGVESRQESLLMAYREVCRILRPDRRTHGSNVFETVFHRGADGWQPLGYRREETFARATELA